MKNKKISLEEFKIFLGKTDNDLRVSCEYLDKHDDYLVKLINENLYTLFDNFKNYVNDMY